MMMTVGPKIAITSNPLDSGLVDGTAAATGTGDMFVQMLAGMGQPLTLMGDGEAAPDAFQTGEGQENLTIKTFQKLLGVKSGETEPDLALALALGESALTKDGADGLTEIAGEATMLSPQPLAVAPLVPPMVGAPSMIGGQTAPAPAPVATSATAIASALLGVEGAAAEISKAIVVPQATQDPLAKAVPNAVAAVVAKPGLDATIQMAAVEQASTTGLETSPLPAGAADTVAAEAATGDVRPAPTLSTSSILSSIFTAPAQPGQNVQPMTDLTAGPAMAGEAVDPMLEQQLDLAHEGEWLDRLARDIARTAGAEGGLRFRLNPENLGSLHVELTQGQAGASLRLTADTEAARAIIADAQPRLVAEARAQGVRIAETHVDLGPGGHSAPGEQRRQESEQARSFVRTDRGDDLHESESPEPTVNASERYA